MVAQFNPTERGPRHDRRWRSTTQSQNSSPSGIIHHMLGQPAEKRGLLWCLYLVKMRKFYEPLNHNSAILPMVKTNRRPSPVQRGTHHQNQVSTVLTHPTRCVNLTSREKEKNASTPDYLYRKPLTYCVDCEAVSSLLLPRPARLVGRASGFFL